MERSRRGADVAGRPAARRRVHPALTLLIIAGAQLMIVLDTTIVNIALPHMGEYFHKNQTDMTWAINAYTLAFGGLLLLGGRAADILGRRRMFIIGLALFALGSLLGGLATTFPLLLGGRAIQGIGGAIASPTALSLITVSFREGRERNRAFAVYAAVSGAGGALGLLLGGILAEYTTWRWVLFVNVPIGALVILGAFGYLHESERRKGGFDVLGATASVGGMVALVYAFIHAARDGWNNPQTYLLFPLAGLLLIAFVLVEAFVAEHPMMPIRLLRNRSRAGAYLIMLMVGAGLFGMFYFLTFFFQQVMGYSALRSGVAYLPFPFVIAIGSQLVAQLLPRIGPKPLLTAGSTLMTLSLLWLARVDPGTGYWGELLPGMIVLALGLSMLFVPLTTTAVSNVANTDAGIVSALLNVGQQVGGSIGLSVLATVFATAARNTGTSQVHDLAGNPTALQHLQQLNVEHAGGPRAPSAAWQDSTAVHALHSIQSHGSAMGFLAAAVFGAVAVAAALLMINVRGSGRPTRQPATDALAEAAA
ncbi:MAG TPA: MFS transporter [Mycobacteriales bacterium]|nr:MFS transporter [Mycobacteriales bacterium]